jgi:hypothetical protein
VFDRPHRDDNLTDRIGDRTRHHAPDVHTFCPLTTKWSPSRTARVRSEARSEPPPGSLIPSDAVISARKIGNQITMAATIFDQKRQPLGANGSRRNQHDDPASG